MFLSQSGGFKNCGTIFGGNSRFGTNGISIVGPGCSLGTFTWRYSGVPRLPKSIVIAICRFCHCHLSGLWTSILLNDVPGRRDTQSSGKAIQKKRFILQMFLSSVTKTQIGNTKCQLFFFISLHFYILENIFLDTVGIR